MRVDCGFKGHERNASIFIGFPLQMARNQFEGNLTWVRIPPAALEYHTNLCYDVNIIQEKVANIQ